jgi:hypothetical protein
MQISSFPCNSSQRGCLFSIVCFWNLWQKSGGHSCVDSYLGCLFCSTGLFLCQYHAVFIAIALYSVFVSHPALSFCSVLPWLFVEFCWCIPLFSEFGRLRQEDQKFKANLCYIEFEASMTI